MAADERPGIRPRLGIRHSLDAFSRKSFPVVSTLLGMVVIAAPLGLPGAAELLPAFVLVAVYFWSLFRPRAMPPVAVFVLGVLSGLLSFGPLGVRALILLCVYGFALRWRKSLVGQRFSLVWLAFVGVAAAATGLEWALDSALALSILPPSAAIFEFVLALGIYPPIALFLTRAHHGIAASEQA